jgi:hypothetical protein
VEATSHARKNPAPNSFWFFEADLIRRYDLPDMQHDTLFDRLRRFFNELYDLAEVSRSEVLTEEHVRKNDIPPRV